MSNLTVNQTGFLAKRNCRNRMNLNSRRLRQKYPIGFFSANDVHLHRGREEARLKSKLFITKTTQHPTASTSMEAPPTCQNTFFQLPPAPTSMKLPISTSCSLVSPASAASPTNQNVMPKHHQQLSRETIPLDLENPIVKSHRP